MLARYINFKTPVRLLATVILISVIFTGFSSTSFAATGLNKTINFQGKVVNKTTGTNVANGAYDFTFKLYDAATSGSLLWTENWTGGNQITVTDGIFRANLGSITTFSSAGVDFNTDNLYLDITFNGEHFTSSRIQLTAAPYALNADKVHGLTVADTTGSFNLTNGKTLAVTDSTTLATNSITFAGGASEILTLAANKAVTFADAFTTSGAFPLTLTTTGSTSVTLPTSGTLATADQIPFLESSGLIFPKNSTEDFFVGGQSTSSAKFAVLGSNTTTPVASISGIGATNNPALLLRGSGAIESQNLGLLTLGGGNTGDILLNPGTGKKVQFFSASNTIDSSGNLIIAGDFTLSAHNIATDTSTGTKIGTATNQKLGFYNSTPIVQPSGNALTALANLGLISSPTLAQADITGLTTGSSPTFAGLTLSGLGVSSAVYTDGSHVLTTTAPTSGTIGYLQRLSGDLSPATLNDTISATSAADTVATFTSSVPSGTITTNTLIQQTGAGTITNLLNLNRSAGTVTNAINVTGTIGTAVLKVGSNTILDNTGILQSAGFSGTYSNGVTLSNATITAGGDLTLNAHNIATDTSTGTKIGTATNQKLGFYNSTPIVQPSGNALTALANLGLISSPTLTKTDVGLSNVENTALSTWAGSTNLTTAGALTVTSLNLGTGSLTANGSTGAGQCLTGGTTATWGSCGSGGISYWTDLNGADYPNSLTNDLLLGSAATASAKFGVIGIKTTTPYASISAIGSTNNPALVLRGTGAIESQNLGALTIGGGNTGDIVLSQGSGKTIKLGTAGSINGGLTFLNAGASTNATITTDSSGNLILSTTQSGAQVQVGSGNGNIQLSLSHQADGLVADKTLGSLSGAYAGNDFTFKRAITAGATGLGGSVLYITDISSGSTLTRPYDLIFGDEQVSGFAGNLLRLDNGGSDIFTASASGAFITSTLASTNFAGLTIGNSQTGNIVIAPGSGKTVTINGLTISSSTGTLTIANGKTLTTSDSTTLGTNSITLAGGEVVTFTASNALTLNTTGSTNITLPTSGTLITNNSGAFQLDTTNGVIYQNQATTDFLLGGTSTSSALFSVIGMNSGAGNATASISGSITLHNAVANINALNGDDFAFKTSVGGDAGLATQLTIKNNGNVGIGTTTPADKLDVNGNIVLDQRTNTATANLLNWTPTSNAAGTITSAVGGTTGIASASAMANYNGSLYAGTCKTGGAEVYIYTAASGTLTAGAWTRVSNSTAGTIQATQQSAIDCVSAMTVFNGKLYIGVTKNNSAAGAGAEVYEYEGSSTWTQITGTKGTIGTGATTAIDGVSSLVVYNGTLYAGTTEPGKAEIYKWDGGTTWTKVSGATAGTIGTAPGAGLAGQDTVSAMTVYYGYLYAATDKLSGGAEFYRYDSSTRWSVLNVAGGTIGADTLVKNINQMVQFNGRLLLSLDKGSGGAAGDIMALDGDASGIATNSASFTRLNDAAGTIVAGGTATIDGVSDMIVYRGALYIGTAKANAAEIYRYEYGDGTTSVWTKISQSAAGTIGSNGSPTTAIDGIADFQTYGDNLMVSTNEPAKGEIYGYNYVSDASYSLKFAATDTLGGGVQNNNVNFGSIYFVASSSAFSGESKVGTGEFVFSDTIVTRSGSYDVAEDYPTRDDSLEAGDLVSIDTNEAGFVKKSSGIGDNNLIGVYSTNPALVLSQQDATINGGNAIPVALAGRVPVKVSTESGEIKSGDYLTPSSVPGVAMKAVGNVPVFAQAMDSFNSDGIGQITVFIKGSGSSSNIVDSLDSITMKSDTFSLKNSSGNSVMTVDKDGNAVFSGMITAKTIKADQIIGLEVLTNKISSLDDRYATLSAGLNTQDMIASIEAQIASSASSSASQIQSINLSSDGLVSGDLRVKGNGLFEGMLSVIDTLTTNDFIVNGLSTFFGDTVFKGNNIFEGRATFNSDSGGFAKIKKGDRLIVVTFDHEYDSEPVIQASVYVPDITNDLLKNYVSEGLCDENDSSDDCQNKVETQFLSNSQYLITRKSTKGFTILLQKDAPIDTTFSWTAVSIKDAKVFDGSQKATVSAAFGN